jgi:hypothetical protein
MVASPLAVLSSRQGLTCEVVGQAAERLDREKLLATSSSGADGSRAPKQPIRTGRRDRSRSLDK